MTRPTAPAVNYDAVPQELRSLNRWVLWRFVQKERKDGTKVWTKMPFTRAGRAASSTDAKTWCSFDEIQDADLFGATPHDGVGITFDGSDRLVGIDLDDCIDVLGNYSALAQQVLDRIPGYAEVSPSGTGIKLWTRAITDSHKTSEGAPDAVEIYPNGRYFTVTGNTVVDPTRDAAIPAEPTSIDWLVAQVFGPGAVRTRSTASTEASGDDSDADALALYRRPLDGWPLERVKEELLPVLDPGCSYDEWLQIGAALHHQGEGSDDWLEAWDEWSAGSADKWAEGYCQEKWDSFHVQRISGRGPVTLATVLKLVADAKQRMHGVVLDEWMAKIAAAATGIDLELKVCPEIARDVRLDETMREALVQNHLKPRFKALSFILPVANIRKLVAPVKAAEQPRSGGAGGPGRLPDWAARWIYVTSEDVLLHLDTKEELTVQAFNFKYNRELVALAGPDDSVNAYRFAAEVLQLDVVGKKMYLPWAELLFEHEGVDCVNTYRPDLVPAVCPAWDEAAVHVASLCEQHLFGLFNDRAEAFELIDWMAFCVQNPGRKIRWAPLIKGCEGDGKSTIATMLAAAMGTRNVKTVSAKALAEGFTGWAEGACVRIMEELRVHNASRLDLLDVIKPYVTNDVVTVRRMRTDEYNAPNTQNYLGFTNHNDALPLQDMDRRWWIAFTRCQTKEDVAALYPAGYFTRLMAALELHPGAVRRWLLEWPVRDSFRQHGPAPGSAAKLIMAGSNKSEDDWIIESVVQTGGVGFSESVVSTSHLRGAIAASGDHLTDHKFGLSRALTRLGFVQYPRVMWWEGAARRVWVKDGALLLDKQRVKGSLKNLLDATLVNGDDPT